MMKKGLFTLWITLLAIFAQAQVTVFSEGFEEGVLPVGWTSVDADNDGSAWVHSSTTYVNGYESEGAYVSFSKLNGAALTPDNWLITPAITLSGDCSLHFWRMSGFSQPAEHYGIFVSTTSATDLSSFTLVYEETLTAYNWVDRTVDLSTYAGSTIYIAFRHYNCTNKLALILDDVSVTTTSTSPLITATPSGLNFVNVPAGTASAYQTVTVNASNISGDITATVPAPFEVSSDNINFSTTTTLPDTGYLLYVRYYPIGAGVDTGSLTVFGGTASAEVLLVGNSIECDVTLPYEQNFNGLPENSIPECWSKINPFDGYPKLTDDYSDAPGDNVLMFKCNFNTYEPIYAVLPLMPMDLSQLQISFFTFREGSYSGKLSVGYVTSPGDSSSFVPVWSITAAQIGDNNMHPYIVSFENVVTSPDSNYYITFKYETSSNWYWFVDNVVVEELPFCGAPTDLTNVHVTSNSATINWTGSASGYILYYKTTYDTAFTENMNVVPDANGYTIEGLLPATTYIWYVASMCDDGSTVNSMSTSTFTTECATFATPFVQNFDASTNLPLCWGRYSGLANEVFAGGTLTSTNSGWAFNNTHVFGANHAKVNVYGGSCRYWLVSPAIDLSTLTNPTLTFDLALTSYNTANPISDPSGQPDDKFMVIVSTDFGATWSYDNATVWDNTTGDFVFNQIPATGDEISISLSEYAGQTVMIAFYCESTLSNGDNDIHIDNVLVANASNCPKPSNLAVNNVTSNSVTLSWTENGTSTAWNIEYGPSGFVQGSAAGTVVSANSNPFTINNLSANAYDFYVQADCGGEQSLWVGPVTATPGSFNIGISGSDTLTTCSVIIYDNGGNSSSYSANCNYVLVLYPETEGSAIALSGTYNTESCCDHLYIYDGTEATGTPLGEYSGSGTIPTLTSSAGPMTIRFVSDYGLQNSGFELFVSCTSCSPPGNLTASEITPTSAILTWTGTSAPFLVEYQAVGDTVWGTELTSDTTLTLTGLSETTAYIVNVYGDCNGEYSPAATIGFSTTMVPASIPYSTDFSDEPYWLFNRGNCHNFWTIGSLGNSGSALFVTSNGNTAGYSLNYFSNISAEKLFTIGDAQDVLISFDVKVGGETDFDYLKVFFAPAGEQYPASTAITPYAEEDFQTYAVNFSNYMQYSSYLSYPYKFNLTGDSTVHVSVTMPNPNANPNANSTAKLVFLWKNDNNGGDQPGAIIYNVSIGELSCPAPTDLTVSNISTTSGDISWNPAGSEENWTLEYKESSDSVWTSVSVSGTPSYTLTSLNVGAAYQVRVQAVCGANDQSLWVSTMFFTPCDAITSFPYTEDFEHGGFMPECWSQEYVISTVNWSFQTGTSNPGGFTSAHSGTYNAFFFEASTTYSTTRLVSPVFDLTGVSNPYLSYWFGHKMRGNSLDQLTVYYRTSLDGEWQLLSQNYGSIDVWTMDSVALPNPSATYQIAFTGIANNGYGVVLDDITIAASSDIPVVTDPTVATTAANPIEQTTATLNAAITNPDNVTITAKGFEWKATTGGSYTQIAGTGTGNTFSANLSGLTANTGYTYKAFITFNGTTVYGSEMTFTTLPEDTPEPCEAPTNLHESGVIFDKTLGIIDVVWEDQAGATQWNLQYRLESESDWNTVTVNEPHYTLDNLEGGAVYVLRVQAVCDNGTLSDWSNTLTAVAQIVGIANYLENSVVLFPNPTNDVINVQCTMNNVQLKGIEIIDVYGKVVRTVVGANNYSPMPTRINVHGLANGMYFVRVTTDEGVATKTFIKK